MYIVYKLSGGLNHMLNQINHGINLSKKTGRFLIIDTMGGSFNNDFNKYFYIPNFEYSTNYNNINEEDFLRYEKYINSKVKYNNKKYLLEDIIINKNVDEITNSTEKFIFYTYIDNGTGIKKWNIKVRHEIYHKIITEKQVISQEYVGMHFRNTDMKHDLKELVTKFMKYHVNTIYLSTDDYSARKKIETMLPSFIKIIQYTYPIDNGGKNIHYSDIDKDELIMNSLIDMYFLSKSNHFIESKKSSFSERVNSIRLKDEFFI
jgi:hypothetical protein